ncbi:uncharacterized protein BO80DRAFT_14902 [Aspergillus ibericus CBS 121593]|uniref:Uncharacterized protein n=1 Tax=Aspergillus ibericus CBS 121593 TaxID=1448316 RepID=A0A395H5M9_9EURO|nr:hypothetical protein BO80DRAFT_14902 [Aspergillus ibericus CBS 121593]RAL03181.1 hypothetical protein BO80DRAFT_14902 [Aspergillus ibericus CBS 121593]
MEILFIAFATVSSSGRVSIYPAIFYGVPEQRPSFLHSWPNLRSIRTPPHGAAPSYLNCSAFRSGPIHVLNPTYSTSSLFLDCMLRLHFLLRKWNTRPR